VGGTYTVTQSVNGCISAAGSGVAVPNVIPATPVVIVSNNCANSVLSTTATGSLLWSNNATTSSITVTAGGTFTVTQTVNGCISLPGSGSAAPVSCGGNIFPTATTCSSFGSGTAERLTRLCYDADSRGKVSNAQPGVFFYWAKVTAPGSSFCVEVVQKR